MHTVVISLSQLLLQLITPERVVTLYTIYALYYCKNNDVILMNNMNIN